MSQFLQDIELLSSFRGSRVPLASPCALEVLPHVSGFHVLSFLGPLLLSRMVVSYAWQQLRQQLQLCFGDPTRIDRRLILSGWAGLDLIILAFRRVQAVSTKEEVDQIRAWLEGILSAVIQQSTAHSDGSGRLEHVLAQLSVPNAFVKLFSLPSESLPSPSPSGSHRSSVTQAEESRAALYSAPPTSSHKRSISNSSSIIVETPQAPLRRASNGSNPETDEYRIKRQRTQEERSSRPSPDGASNHYRRGAEEQAQRATLYSERLAPPHQSADHRRTDSVSPGAVVTSEQGSHGGSSLYRPSTQASTSAPSARHSPTPQPQASRTSTAPPPTPNGPPQSRDFRSLAIPPYKGPSVSSQKIERAPASGKNYYHALQTSTDRAHVTSPGAVTPAQSTASSPQVHSRAPSMEDRPSSSNFQKVYTPPVSFSEPNGNTVRSLASSSSATAPPLPPPQTQSEGDSRFGGRQTITRIPTIPLLIATAILSCPSESASIQTVVDVLHEKHSGEDRKRSS